MKNQQLSLKVSIVVPVFNEESTVKIFSDKIYKVFASEENLDLEIIFVNDGSEDKTLDRLFEVRDKFPSIYILDFTRNFGKESALTAGLMYSTGDLIVLIDVDLQDPPELILNMIDRWAEGYDIVLARRVNRDSDSFLKRSTASVFYRIYNKIADLKIPENVGDFRLMDRKVVNALNHLPESRRFMKGLLAWVGFRVAYIDYVRPSRSAGLTKFNFWGLLNLALEGVTSFSTYPLRVWSYVGLITATLSFLYAIFLIFKVFIQGVDLPGYASLMVAITFIGGLQLVGIGVIGEYLGRTYIESKRRPIYIIREVYKPQG